MDRDDLIAKFGTQIQANERLMAEALLIIRTYTLTPEELFFRWEAYVLPRLQGPPSAIIFNLENLLDLKKDIALKLTQQAKIDVVKVRVPAALAGKSMAAGLNDLLGNTPAKKARSLAPHASSSPNNQATPYQPLASMPSRLKSSPAASASSAAEGSMSSPPIKSPANTPFHARPAKLALQETLNKSLSLPTARQKSSEHSRITLASTMDPKAYTYRYMYERMMERSEMLDSTIDEAAEILKNHYGIDELGDPSIQSQEDIIAVGRLCPESDSSKLTETTTYLESSRSLGSGSRILLRFDHDMKVRGAPVGSGGVGLYSGCLVGVRGKNGGGKEFAVSEVLMMPTIDPTFTRPTALLKYQEQARGDPLSVIVAAGPYTLDSDFEYAPLAALLEKVAEERPDVLILLGPFVDAQHSLIKSGNLSSTPAEIFRLQISSKLATLIARSKKTAIILVPNGRDLISHHVAYPQSPLMRDLEFGFPKGVKLLPNPTTFSVNEIVFGITSVDVLFHLRNQEMFRKCEESNDLSSGDAPPVADASAKDVMARTCRHLLAQRSYYPLFPVPIGPSLDPLNLDITHNKLISMGLAGADIIILPSMLKHFAKIVDSTIMINPSFLTKGSSAGTFAQLTIHPLPTEELERRADRVMKGGGENEEIEDEGDDEIEHRVWERCRVDIVKV